MRIIKPLFCLPLICAVLSFAAMAQESVAGLLSKASDAYKQQDYKRSAELYDNAIKQGAQGLTVFYNAACAFALAGRRDEAFDSLARAVDRGYANLDHLKQESALPGLHSDPRWAPLVEKCAANFKAQAFWDDPVLKTAFRENISDDEKVAGLSKLWSEIKFNFANFDLVPDLDWDGAYLKYLPKVKNTKTTLEYYRVLIEFCALVKDAHTLVHPPAELDDELYARPAISVRLVEGRVFVQRVYDDKLKLNSIQPGLEIVETNGTPIKEYAERYVTRYQSVSNHGLPLFSYEFNLLSGSSKESLEIAFRDDKGRSFKKTLPRLTSKAWSELTKTSPPSKSMEFKILPGNVAYVALNTFGDEKVVSDFDAAFADIEKTDALILDIRENHGGNGRIGFDILANLTAKPFKTSRWKTRSYRPTFRAQGASDEWYVGGQEDWPAKGNKLYSKPVVVLTGPRTGSAAEDFAVAFDLMKRGELIGEPTAGSTGQPLRIHLPGGGSALICTRRDTYPDGKEFIGVGVQPNVLVQPTIVDFRAGRDTVLEAALGELKRVTHN